MQYFEPENRSQNEPIIVDDQAKTTFIEMAGWTKLLSVFGFIGMAMLAVGGITMSLAVNSRSGGQKGTIFMVVYILLAAVMFYPAYKLFKYSSGIKNALNKNDKNMFNIAIADLKNTFKFYGCTAIVVLAFYGAAFIVLIFQYLMK